jgi:hypothetical protein
LTICNGIWYPLLASRHTCRQNIVYIISKQRREEKRREEGRGGEGRGGEKKRAGERA